LNEKTKGTPRLLRMLDVTSSFLVAMWFHYDAERYAVQVSDTTMLPQSTQMTTKKEIYIKRPGLLICSL
jgi:hypothetical protein